MNRRKPAAAAVSTVLTLLLMPLSGCGIDSSPSPAMAEQKALIQFLAAEYSTDTRPLLESIVKDFEAKYPNIDVELQVANWDILDGVYTTMISKNQPPDLLNTNVYAHFAKDGLLNDWNDILSPELKANLLPKFLQMDYWNGAQYAIPYLATVRNLYYNKDIFDDIGLTGPPKTWSELVETARKIKQTGKAEGFGVDLTDNESQAYLSYFFFGAGGGWMKDGQWTINSPENVEGLTFLKSLYDQGLTDAEPTVTTRDEKHRILGNGKLGTMISGNYFPSVVPREFPGLKWGIGPLPVKDGTPPISFGVQDVLVSFKTDHTNKEALSKFISFLYDDARYESIILREGFLPVTKSVGDKLAAKDKNAKDSLEALQTAQFYPVNHPAWQKVMDGTRKMGQAVLIDHMPPQAALDQLQQIALTKSRE
ncbi:extracellular solute-binding protein [Paenibacillus oleatilyticus]|uniref:extracellular solute-binding protein n=1 Tax=Paenibacillus oleatilyticus TaxID=2594886 RepID=UPI001C1FEDAC|nr:extracellular solute-binding protein [Paenibacillus oleatilyticus]MBU7319138.1 extracellular solute-binding protein [Paenibacillus oleatilyticus]